MSDGCTQTLLSEDRGYSEETCVRCGWRMGDPPLNCQNDDTPHVFPSQLEPPELFNPAKVFGGSNE